MLLRVKGEGASNKQQASDGSSLLPYPILLMSSNAFGVAGTDTHTHSSSESNISFYPLHTPFTQHFLVLSYFV